MDLLKVGAPLPASIGGCADLLHDVRELRLSVDKQAAQIKARESEIREYIIANLSKGHDTGAMGKRYKAQIESKPTPRCTDWKQLHAWIKAHDRFDLLQKRLSDSAVITQIEETGIMLPGVEVGLIPSVSLTKI